MKFFSLVQKGKIRSFVLRSIRDLKQIVKGLEEGKKIKEEEVEEFKEKDPAKTKILRLQVRILEKGKSKIEEAIKELENYRKLKITK
jgi:exonuclease VII small subunit